VGRIVQIVEVLARAIVGNAGGEYRITSDTVTPPGIDAAPLPGDFAALSDGPGTGDAIAVGTQDGHIAPEAQPGEIKLYARAQDGETFVEVGAVYLAADGSITTRNEKGSATLGADGSHTIENEKGSATLGADGSYSAKNDKGSATLGADGSHTHVNAGGAFGMDAGGTINLNGLTVQPSGALISVLGKRVDSHLHTGGTGPTGLTGLNV
jgi:hypothetical protein